MENASWFTLEPIDTGTYCLSEYRHWEHTHSYLLLGERRALLIDTGLGIGSMGALVARLTDKPVAAVATHVHWDHIGGHKYFPDFYAHRAEESWLRGNFPLPLAAVKRMVADRCQLPEGFDLDCYTLFQGHPSAWVGEGDTIDLGGRVLTVLHTPGHSPGHLCFWEESRGYLFSGDLVPFTIPWASGRWENSAVADLCECNLTNRRTYGMIPEKPLFILSTLG